MTLTDKRVDTVSDAVKTMARTDGATVDEIQNWMRINLPYEVYQSLFGMMASPFETVQTACRTAYQRGRLRRTKRGSAYRYKVETTSA